MGRRVEQGRAEIVAWVAGNVLPHEADLRSRLRRIVTSAEEIDDVVQEAYLSIAKLRAVAHIRSGRAYLFSTAHSIMLQRARRERIVRIDHLSETDALALVDDAPDPERRVQAREELERVRRLIEALPQRCREVFELRRIEGVSQRVIAGRLGIPEHTVEQEAVRGLKLLLRALAGNAGADGARPPANGARSLRTRGKRHDA